jgi:hypothetical protein
MRERRVQRNSSLGFGVVMVVLGCVFLLGQLLGVHFWGAGWPLVIVFAGLLFFVGMVTGGKAAGGLAIPGSIITMVGLILFFQNTFNYFESWSYVWALIPLAVGIGAMINGYWSEQPNEVANGRRVAGIGALLFMLGFVFFELVIGIGRLGHQFFGNVVGPLVLVGIGLYLVARNLGGSRVRPTATQPAPPAPRPALDDEIWTKASTLPVEPPVESKKEVAVGENI